jgi:hypothetical protein
MTTTAANNKISSIAGSYLPAFIQDDYVTFVAFLQAYYEFLEQEDGAIWASEKMSEAFDIDETLPAFLDQFKEQYMSLFPSTLVADKATVIKNIKNFYLAKGSEKSLKFMFRVLFGEDIEVYYPNRNILRVSDGKWSKETAIRVTGDIFNIFTGDGNTSTFIISDTVNSEANLQVSINDIIIANTNYNLVGRNLVFSTNIANNDVVSVIVDGGDYQKFVGKQIFGSSTGASAIVSAYKRVFDLGEFFNELTITDVVKDFEVGENAYTFYVDDVNDVSIKIAVPVTSSVIDVDIEFGGAGYNIGDPLIFSSSTGSGANGYVASIYKAGIRSVDVLSRGAGFKSGVLFNVVGGGGTGAAVYLNAVDSSGNVHPNTYNVNNDLIRLYSNTRLNATAYGFPAFSNANLNTALSSAFTYAIYGLCGPIDPTEVLIIAEGENYAIPPTIYLDPPIFAMNVSGNTANVSMTDFGILGSLSIISAGAGYAVGDEVVFTNSSGSVGQDAAAAVTSVSGTGGIAKIDFQSPRIPGTANIAANSNVVFGTGTSFINVVTPNTWITINNETKRVVSVTNSNNMIVSGTWTYSANNKKVGVAGRNFVGGSGYHMTSLPLVSVSSANGSNANVIATAVVGDGEDLIVSGLQPVGRIRTVTVSQGGEGYTIPTNRRSYSLW